MCCLLVYVAIGVFQEYYERELLALYSPSAISWIVSLEIFFMFFRAPIVGILYDNFGPQWLVLTGTFLHVFGLIVSIYIIVPASAKISFRWYPLERNTTKSY